MERTQSDVFNKSLCWIVISIVSYLAMLFDINLNYIFQVTYCL